MGDLISRSALQKVVEDSMENNPHSETMTSAMHCHEHKHFLCLIALQPTVEPEPVVHGEWIFDSFTAKYARPYRCSRCHEEHADTYNFCPNCGAKMDGKSKV